MRRAVAITAVLLGLQAGCFTVENEVCASGRVCPNGLVCSATGETCGPPDQVDACAQVADLGDCSFNNVAGICRKGVCEPIRCGNGFTEPGEQCDDGNDNDDDNCHNDCTALVGQCGDGIVNPDFEECDCGDGTGSLPDNCSAPNTSTGGECNESCQFSCGDGTQTTFEDCEPGEPLGIDCYSYGGEAGLLGCAACAYDRSDCALIDWVNATTIPLHSGSSPLLAIWHSPRQPAASAGAHSVGGFAIANEGGRVSWHSVPPSGAVPGPPIQHDMTGAARGLWGFVDNATTAEVVYAVGDGGEIVVYYDGNPGWTTVPSGTTEDLYGIWGVDQQAQFVVGANGVARRFTGPIDLELTDTGTTATLRAVAGWSATKIIAVGDAGTAILWDGSSWSPIPTGVTATLHAVVFIDADTAYAVGDGGTVLRWFLGEWYQVDIGTSVDLHAVFTTERGVFVGGDGGTILHRANDGTWRSQHNDDTNRVNDFDVAPDGVLYSVSTRVRMTWGYNHQGPVLNAGVAMNDIAVSPGGEMFAVGDAGTAWRYDGRDWEVLTSGTAANLNGVHSYAVDAAYVVGSGGTVLRYEDGSWTDLSLPVSAELNDVWGDADDILVVGDDGIAYEYSGGMWTPINEFGSWDLYTVMYDGTTWYVAGQGLRGWFLDPGQGWMTDVIDVGMQFNSGIVRDMIYTPGLGRIWAGSAGAFDGYFSGSASTGLPPGTLTMFLLVEPVHAIAAAGTSAFVVAGEQGQLIFVTDTQFGRIQSRTTATIRGVAVGNNVIGYVAADGTVDTLVVLVD